jgi:hypothetical protein
VCISSALLAPAALAALPQSAWAVHHIDSVYRTNAAYEACRHSTPDWTQNCLSDNLTLTFHIRNSIGANGHANIRSVLNSEYNPLDFNVVEKATPVYTGGAETDIVYYREDLPSGSEGLSWCENAVNAWFCDQAYNRFRVDVNPGLACHETGHAVGLVHPVNSTYTGSGAQVWPSNDNAPAMGCMQKPVPVGNNGQLGGLNAHNINEVYEGASASAAGAYPSYKE